MPPFSLVKEPRGLAFCYHLSLGTTTEYVRRCQGDCTGLPGEATWCVGECELLLPKGMGRGERPAEQPCWLGRIIIAEMDVGNELFCHHLAAWMPLKDLAGHLKNAAHDDIGSYLPGSTVLYNNITDPCAECYG